MVLYADLADERGGRGCGAGSGASRVLLERCFGLVTESARWRASRSTDPEDYLTDMVFPGQSRSRGSRCWRCPSCWPEHEDPDERSRGRTAGPVPAGRCARCCERLVEDYPAAWSRQASRTWTRWPTTVLAAAAPLGLAVARAGDGWLLSPAAHRWLPEPDGDPEREAAAPAPAGRARSAEAGRCSTRRTCHGRSEPGSQVAAAPRRHRQHLAVREQTFDFSGGRAIFQGTNGSGKSRTLELLLPLCLDGDLRQLGLQGLRHGQHPAADAGRLRRRARTGSATRGSSCAATSPAVDEYLTCGSG